jgi:hypothetical protein
MRDSLLRAAVILTLVFAFLLIVSPVAAGGPPPPGGAPPPPPPAAPHPFTDTGPSQFQFEIAWLYNSGITGGCATSRFCPTGRVTREQMASFLVRGLGLPATSSDFFSDDNASGHEGDINRVAASGITGGCATNRFCPGAVVTRAQMASFLVRALGLPSSGTDRFTDDGSSVHQADINALAASGITGGCAANRFCPGSAVTREQMAAFLYRGLAESSPVFPASAGSGATAAGGVIAGQGLPGVPVAQLACGSSQAWAGAPSVTASQGVRGTNAFVWWIAQLIYWDGVRWNHYSWSEYHFSYVSNAGANPGSPIGSANPPWTRYGGGVVVHPGQGILWNVTPGVTWAVINHVQDNFGDKNSGVAYTSGGSHFCVS